MKKIREHEVAFCAEVKSWVDAIFASHPKWPFSQAKIEQYGTGNNKRSDLRIFQKGNASPVLAGEVKLPGTAEGRSPYDPSLMQDAFNKADNIQAPYFFTWNINTFVLFDRSKWDVPMIQRRVKEWSLGKKLASPEECVRPEVHTYIREIFLPEIFETFSKIVEGKIIEWGMPPDDIFIRSLESHLDWPVLGTRDQMVLTSQQDTAFRAKLQSWMAEEMNWTFNPDNVENWTETLGRAARTLCYVFCNRAIFYEAIRAKYPEHLTELKMPRKTRLGHNGIYDYFRNQFQQAVFASGDYEPIFYPEVGDWAGALVFASDVSCKGWEGLFNNLSQYQFRQIPYDIIGGIFQKLISPEERQKFGQFYTNEDIIDIINAFCIRRAGDLVIDPACGSGSFLVRAYHRKAWLSEHKGGGRRHQDNRKNHQELLGELYGCDLALFASHLATLNLAARRIEDEENYPYILRGNFFEVPALRASFCQVPGLPSTSGKREKRPVELPDLDAIVGNPPYVRQEQIPKASEMKRQKGETKHSYEKRQKTTKDYFQELSRQLWPSLKLSGRSDLHCYFWPVATSLLKENGFFGFLTSSSWLDVEYGFAIQGWILKNFKLIAVLESLDEPWFEDARVKTAVTILQKNDNEKDRMANVVKFVRFLKPLQEVLGERPHGDEGARQHGAESLRRLILQTSTPYSNEKLRIIPISQSQLWEEGVRAGKLLKEGKLEESDSEESEVGTQTIDNQAEAMHHIRVEYAAGKWGRFLRAPNLYFKLMKEYGNRFVSLGEIAEIRFGIKSGCDAFFMPHDVTKDILNKIDDGLPWNDVGLMTHCKRSEVESGKVRIVRAGDNTLHPIEAEFLRPEVHSLMEVDRPVIRAKDLDRLVLWINQPLSALTQTYASKYIRWGSKQTFASKKSKAVPVPQRSTCASRPVWYDLTHHKVGVSFWPKAQKYRHISPTNPERLACNCNLYTVVPYLSTKVEKTALSAILNSTLIALFKCFYGRYAGAEGTLKTEVIDTVLLQIPDPRGISAELAKRFEQILNQISEREVTHLVEEALLQCHSEEGMREIISRPPDLPNELRQEDRRELDNCVLELLGVSDSSQRKKLLQELYYETTNYYRYQRTQDIQTMENRSGKTSRRLGPQDIAESIWLSLSDAEKGMPIVAWIKSSYKKTECVSIPDGKPEALGASDMFNPDGVIFKNQKETQQINYRNAEQAELVVELASVDIGGNIVLPKSESECTDCLEQLRNRLDVAKQRFSDLAASRTGTQALQEKTSSLLLHWYTHGKGA